MKLFSPPPSEIKQAACTDGLGRMTGSGEPCGRGGPLAQSGGRVNLASAIVQKSVGRAVPEHVARLAVEFAADRLER